MTILYTFDASEDSWDGTHLDGPFSDGRGDNSISDTWDFHSHRWEEYDGRYWVPGNSGISAFLAFAWTQALNPSEGLVHRMVFKLSVAEWAHVEEDGVKGNSFLEWRSADEYDADPGGGDWCDRLSFHVDQNGHIYELFTDVHGVAVLAPGVEYDVVIIVTLDVATQVKSYRIFIEGGLDLAGSMACNLWTSGPAPDYESIPGAYPPGWAELEVGYTWGTEHIHNQTIHIGGLVWTIESLAAQPMSAAWMMNTVL